MGDSGGISVFVPVATGVLCVSTLLCAVCLIWGRCRTGCFHTCRERRRRRELLKACTVVRYCGEKSSRNETCPICLDDFRKKESVILCPCSHGYHKNCLSGWLQTNTVCPVCKADVVVLDERPTAESSPLFPRRNLE